MSHVFEGTHLVRGLLRSCFPPPQTSPPQGGRGLGPARFSLGNSAQTELAFSLSRRIRDWEAEGFYVYAARVKRTLQFRGATLLDAELLVVVVTRQLVDFLDVVLT